MKKTLTAVALVLMGGALFAQGPGMGQGTGMGPGSAIEWKIGNSITSEYKKLTGQISSSTTLWGSTMVFKAEGTEYQLMLPRVTELASLKSGDTITIEGMYTTVKADTKVPATVHAVKVTVNGKEIDLSTLRGNRMDDNGRGMMRGDGMSGATTGRGR